MKWKVGAILLSLQRLSQLPFQFPSTKTIEVGETFTPTYSLTPSNASTTVTWSSDDSSVASVDSNTGLVTGKKPERHTSMLQLQMARQIGVQLL